MGFLFLRLGKRQITRWGFGWTSPEAWRDSDTAPAFSLGLRRVGWSAQSEAHGQNSAKVTLEVKKRDKLVLS